MVILDKKKYIRKIYFACALDIKLLIINIYTDNTTENNNLQKTLKKGGGYAPLQFNTITVMRFIWSLSLVSLFGFILFVPLYAFLLTLIPTIYITIKKE